MASSLLQRTALWIYRQADRSGALSSRPARRVFELAYGRYKRHVEDPFYNLARRHPELFAGVPGVAHHASVLDPPGRPELGFGFGERLGRKGFHAVFKGHRVSPVKAGRKSPGSIQYTLYSAGG